MKALVWRMAQIGVDALDGKGVVFVVNVAHMLARIDDVDGFSHILQLAKKRGSMLIGIPQKNLKISKNN